MTLLEKAEADAAAQGQIKKCKMALSIINALPEDRWGEVRELIASELQLTTKARTLASVGIMVTPKNLGAKINQGGCKCLWCASTIWIS